MKKLTHHHKHMQNFHDKLMEKDGAYAKWHRHPGHHIFQWLFLILVAVLVGKLLVDRVNQTGTYGLFTKAAGTTIVVPTGSDPIQNGINFQSALDTVNCGDTIVLTAGATYSNAGKASQLPFYAKNVGACDSTSWITIRTSDLASLPPAGTRVTPADASTMPKVLAASSHAALQFTANANHYQIIGIEFTNIGGSVFNNSLVIVDGGNSNGAEGTFLTQPDHITFDRVWIHEATNDTTTPDSANTTSTRGMVINATDVTVKESRIAGFRNFHDSVTAESSNAILFPNSALRVNVINNYIEAWFVPIFFGGASGQTDNTATVSPGATLTQATLSNVNNLNVGDLIAFKVVEHGGILPPAATCSSCPVVFQVAKVDAINGNIVTYHGQYNYAGTGGNPLLVPPDSPGLAQWNGYVNQDILLQRNQIVENFNSTEYIWTHTGGCSTLLVPYPSACGYGNAPKGFIEIKMGRNVTINANTFEGWHSGWTVTTRNQGNYLTSGGIPWATIENLRITNNYWKRTQNWNRIFSAIIGGPSLEDNEFTSVRGHDVLVENNLMDSGAGPLLAAFANADNVTVRHNTFPGMDSNGGSMILGGWNNKNFVFQDNILQKNEYGFNCQAASGINCWESMTATHNVFIGPQLSERQ